MKTRIKPKIKKSWNGGASAVEFALVLPFLLLILFGIIEYGWLLTWQIVMTNAVSEGARAAVTTNDDDEALTFAKQAVQKAFWLENLKEGAVMAEIQTDAPKRILVKAAGSYKPLTGFLPSPLIPEIISAKAVMVFP